MWYLAALLVLVTTLLAMSFGIRLTEQLERENRLVEAELESSGIYSEALRRKAAEARRYRHDAAGLMQAIERQLAQDAQGAQGAQSTREMQGSHAAPFAGEQPADTPVPDSRATAARPASEGRTGLLLVDAILSLKEAQCREKGIPLSVEAGPLAQAGETAGIPEGDVAALVQNLLDNAIEASEHVDASHRFVRLHAGASGRRLAIRVENRTEASERPTFRTRKANPELHGLGTGIVDGIAQAHGGTRDVDFDPHERILSIRVTLGA